MSSGLLPLSNKRLQRLLNSKKFMMRAFLKGSIKQVYSIVHDDIDEELVKRAAIKTKNGCIPSGFDAGNLCRILVSKLFGLCSLVLP